MLSCSEVDYMTQSGLGVGWEFCGLWGVDQGSRRGVVGGGSILLKEELEGFVLPVVTEVWFGSGDLSSCVGI